MKTNENNHTQLKNALAQLELLFVDPAELWKKSRYEIRQLLIMVWFSTNIQYKKNLGYRTNDTSGLYYPFSLLKSINSRDSATGEINPNQTDILKKEIQSFLKAFLTQAEHINLIFKLHEIPSV